MTINVVENVLQIKKSHLLEKQMGFDIYDKVIGYYPKAALLKPVIIKLASIDFA